MTIMAVNSSAGSGPGAEPKGPNSSPATGSNNKYKISVHVLICTTPGVGHMNPVLELSQRIAARGNVVTVVSSELQISKLLQDKDAEQQEDLQLQRFGGLDIRLVGLWDGYPINQRPPLNVNTIWEVIKNLETEIERYLERLMEEKGTSAAGPPVTSIITDNHLWYTQKAADRLKIPRYIFYPNSTFYVALMWYIPQLVSQGLLQLGPALSHNGQEQLKMPGFPDLPFDKFPSSSRERPHIFLSCAAGLPAARGILINTFPGLEDDGITALQTGLLQVPGQDSHLKIPPLLPVGPLFSSSLFNKTLSSQETASVVQFLDSKPPSSVLYVAFGTEALISRPQIMELAMGLEASVQPFLWVLRLPASTALASKDEILGAMAAMLPLGFRERTADRGLILSNLAPQLLVLSHASTGAFLTHCGWNSVMESIHRGVPMLAFPQGADQLMNCRFVVDKVKVGIELLRAKDQPESKGHGMANKEEVEKAVRRILTGDEREGFEARIGELRKLALAADVPAHENLQVFLEQITVQ